MIVVDVNVIAYALIEGERTEAARAVLARDPDWTAPLLWRSEWRNVLAGYLRRGAMDRADVVANLRVAEKLLRGGEHVPDSVHVIDLLARSRCTAYDCEYVAIAESLGVPLITADRRVLGDFPSIAQAPEAFVA